MLTDMRYVATLFGRPPFWPFARAAAALASDVALPPLRPSATAAGFLRGMAANLRQAIRHRLPRGAQASNKFCVCGRAERPEGACALAPEVCGLAVDLAASSLSTRGERVKLRGVRGVLSAKGVVSHAPIKPYRLGFVK